MGFATGKILNYWICKSRATNIIRIFRKCLFRKCLYSSSCTDKLLLIWSLYKMLSNWIFSSFKTYKLLFDQTSPGSLAVDVRELLASALQESALTCSEVRRNSPSITSRSTRANPLWNPQQRSATSHSQDVKLLSPDDASPFTRWATGIK